MGHVYQTVTLIADKEKKVRMLVDTGATYSMVSKDLAKELGLKPFRKRMLVELADGRKVRLPVGMAMVRIKGREAVNTILIGGAGEPLLGVEALEALGFAVDPSSRELIQTRSYAVRLGGYRRVKA